MFEQSDFSDINTVVLKGMHADSFSIRTNTNKSSPIASTNMRDQWMLDTLRAMGQTASEFTYVHLYVNGLYWGLYEAVERMDDASLASRLGGEPEDWDIVRPFSEIVGSDEAWNATFDLARQISASNPQGADAIYYQLQGLNPNGTQNEEYPVYVDMDSLIDYLILHYYAGAQEWVQGNFVYARNRVDPGSGFKFFAWDQDVSLDAFDVTHQNKPASGTSTAQELRWRLTNSAEFRLRFADRAQMHLFNDGVLTNEQASERWQRLADQIGPAIVSESARWGDVWEGSSVVIGSGDPPVILPKITIDVWRDAVDAVHGYIPDFNSRLLPRLINAGLFSTLAAPLLNHFGGEVGAGFQFQLSKSVDSPESAKIYFTLDGSDPRLVGGILSSSAIEYTGPITVDDTLNIKTRMLDGTTWSALDGAVFDVTDTPPEGLRGDYDNNNVVDGDDYIVWKASFGMQVQPGSGADGNRNGVVDAADYTVWRDNLGAMIVVPPDFSFDTIGQTYAQDFNDFLGTEATLPAHFSVTVVGGTDIYRGVFDSTASAASAFTGIMAATTDSADYSFSWRESTGAAGLNDTRVLFTFTNNTGEAIGGFDVSYDVEAWVNGRRDNQLRFKYDVYADSAASQAAEGRDAFETDIFATLNPNHTPIAANGDQFVLDGKAEANRATVSGFVDFSTLLISEANPGLGVFGALQPGQTAYFRWQISNGLLSDGNRSALGIDNMSITPLADGFGAAALSSSVPAAISVLSANEAETTVVTTSLKAGFLSGDSSSDSQFGRRDGASGVRQAAVNRQHSDRTAFGLLLLTRGRPSMAPDYACGECESLVDLALEELTPTDSADDLLSILAADLIGR